MNFFSIVNDKVGKGETNERGLRHGVWRGYMNDYVEWEVNYFNGVINGKAVVNSHRCNSFFEGNIINNMMEGMWVKDRKSVV